VAFIPLINVTNWHAWLALHPKSVAGVNIITDFQDTRTGIIFISVYSNIRTLSMTSTTTCNSFVVKNHTSFTGDRAVLLISCKFYRIITWCSKWKKSTPDTYLSCTPSCRVAVSSGWVIVSDIKYVSRRLVVYFKDSASLREMYDCRSMLHNIFKNQKLATNPKLILKNTIIDKTLTYGSETSTLTKRDSNWTFLRGKCIEEF
jgi:hypothetical protein